MSTPNKVDVIVVGAGPAGLSCAYTLAKKGAEVLVIERGSYPGAKNMFGGISFLLKGKMCCGVLKDVLVVRVNPDESESLLKKPHVRPMDFTGKPMKGFLYISTGGYKTDKQLGSWVERSIDFVSSLPKRRNQ